MRKTCASMDEARIFCTKDINYTQYFFLSFCAVVVVVADVDDTF